MKKIITILLAVFASAMASAQDYYTGKNTVTADGITFTVDRELGLSLENINNTRTEDGNLYYKNGNLLEEELIDHASATGNGGTKKALEQTFTKEEYLRLKRLPEFNFWILLVLDSNGDTVEVFFTMDEVPELLAMPPSKFALLEKNLKKYVKWELNDLAKKLKYMHGFNFVNFKRLELDYPQSPPTPGTPVTNIPLE